jgi:hypothetical protein
MTSINPGTPILKGYAPLVNLDPSRFLPSKHPKYSPNLYEYLTAPSKKQILKRARVFRDAGNVLWLGYLDDLGSLIGSKMAVILRDGASTWAYSYCPNGFVEVENFWDEYERVGRCAVDPTHQGSFANTESRWKLTGNMRCCQWCGNATQMLVEIPRTVIDKVWQDCTPAA